MQFRRIFILASDFNLLPYVVMVKFSEKFWLHTDTQLKKRKISPSNPSLQCSGDPGEEEVRGLQEPEGMGDTRRAGFSKSTRLMNFQIMRNEGAWVEPTQVCTTRGPRPKRRHGHRALPFTQKQSPTDCHL